MKNSVIDRELSTAEEAWLLLSKEFETASS
jgi:hypothetical protein